MPLSRREMVTGPPPAGEPQTAWERLKTAYVMRAMATVMSGGMIPVGVIGLAMGKDSSRAFSVISGGSLVAHAFGGLLALGGVFVLVGIARAEAFGEVMGLSLIAMGAALYAGGVYLGLGLNGLIAGSLAALISLGAASRVSFLLRLAKMAKQADPRHGR